MVRILLLTVLVAAVAVPAATAVANSTPPAPAIVWAKVQTAWTRQAQALGQPVVCEAPTVLNAGVWIQKAVCKVGPQAQYSTYGLLNRALHGSSTACTYSGAVSRWWAPWPNGYVVFSLNVCKAGWLAQLPQIRQPGES